MEMGAGGNEAEIGMPMSVSYGHMAAAHAQIHEANSKPNNSNMGADNCSTASDQEIRPLSHEAAAAAAGVSLAKPRSVKYRECLKNHAASIGGHANDGCGEFMPSGDEGTLEALKCAACGCHRNFHRRDTNNGGGDPSASCYYCCYASNGNGNGSSKRPGGLHLSVPAPHVPLALPSSPSGITRSHPQMIMAIRDVGGEDHDHMMSGAGAHAMYMAGHAMKKRFRTKFTQEQKDKMCAFAEKLGWRIQKHDDLAVQQFCMDVGVKRHVLKVWMHNNKHTLAKKP